LPYSSRLLGEVARGFLLDHLTRDAMALQHYLMRSVTRTHVRSKWHRYRTDYVTATSHSNRNTRKKGRRADPAQQKIMVTSSPPELTLAYAPCVERGG